MNKFDMFRKILDYCNENQLYDNFDYLEIELNEISEKTKKWAVKVEKIYNEMKKEGII